MSLIDYRKIADSIDFYETRGYARVEAHWWVPEAIMNITAPKGREGEALLYKIPKNGKCLVASGEQSFLYMANQGMLPPGRYQTTTPCFRDESQGPLRRKYFLKNELIVTDNVSQGELEGVIDCALDFFVTQVPNIAALCAVQTADGFDIEYGGVEIGSYGIRETSFLRWIYATGCAEPRLSRAIEISEFKGNK